MTKMSLASRSGRTEGWCDLDSGSGCPPGRSPVGAATPAASSAPATLRAAFAARQPRCRAAAAAVADASKRAASACRKATASGAPFWMSIHCSRFSIAAKAASLAATAASSAPSSIPHRCARRRNSFAAAPTTAMCRWQIASISSRVTILTTFGPLMLLSPVRPPPPLRRAVVRVRVAGAGTSPATTPCAPPGQPAPATDGGGSRTRCRCRTARSPG